MICPGCGSRVSVDVGFHGAQDLLVEVSSGKCHDSTRCHAADPVRKAARLAERVLADRVAAFDSQLRLYPETYCRDDAQEHEEAKAKLAALRAAMEG